MLKRADGLQVIRISTTQAVVKRGIQELLLSGHSTVLLLEPLIELLDGSRTAQEIIEEFPGSLRPTVEKLLDGLSSRSLIVSANGHHTASLETAFFANFGQFGEAAMKRLATETVVIYGVNLISKTLVNRLLEVNTGAITVVNHPILNNNLVHADWLDGLAKGSESRVHVVDALESAVEDCALICATSDFGLADALLHANETALETGKPYLPVWIDEMIGCAGPLVYPHETACLRCLMLRQDSNDQHRDVSEAVRAHTTGKVEARPGTGLLTPMAGIMGEIAAMEIIKTLGGFAPSDTLGRLIEINLLSFRSRLRRVLKLPRCPDCSDVMLLGSKVTELGPQIPQR